MTVPAIAAQRFAASCILGAMLGIWYGFLRPLGPRHTLLRDLLFLPAALWAWLQLMFGVCRGDLRIWAFWGLILGVLLWDKTVGRLLRPLFSGFWGLIMKIINMFLFPWKKILEKLKILFASWGKSVTIKWSNR